jgi:Protein of unknown function (DUF3572)
MKPATSLTQTAAEELAIQALTFIADEPERLERFLSVTGIALGEIRAAAGQPGFLAGILEYVAADERLLTDFAADARADPADIGKALVALGAGAGERDGA